MIQEFFADLNDNKMQKSKDFRSVSRTAQKIMHNYELISELLNTDDGIKLDLENLLVEKSQSV